MGRQFLINVLLNLCWGSAGHKIWDPSWELRHWWYEFTKHYDGTLICFSILILNFMWKTEEGEAESIVLLIFVLWRCFNRRWVKSYGVMQKIVFSNQGVSRSNKYDTYGHVVSTLYFSFFILMSHCCFRFLSFGNL